LQESIELAHLQSNNVVLVDFWKGNDGDPGVLLVLGEGVVGEDAVGELVEDFYY